MSEDGGYDLKPDAKKPLPGDPDFVPPVPVIIKADEEAEAPKEPVDPDVEANKAMAILGYILFLIPLLAAPNSKFARYHANQGLMVFIIWFIAVIGVAVLEGLYWMVSHFFSSNIPIVFYFFACIFRLVQPALLIGALAATIYGIIQAANGQKKGLPLIGHMTLIK